MARLLGELQAMLVVKWVVVLLGACCASEEGPDTAVGAGAATRIAQMVQEEPGMLIQ